MSVWKSDETLLSICILSFSFKNDFVWEEISNIRHSVSSPDETPRSSSKILRCASYFQLFSRCFIWWWNTASHVWYITSNIVCGVKGGVGPVWIGKRPRNAKVIMSFSHCFVIPQMMHSSYKDIKSSWILATLLKVLESKLSQCKILEL